MLHVSHAYCLITRLISVSQSAYTNYVTVTELLVQGPNLKQVAQLRQRDRASSAISRKRG